jgi:hypothetical protein
MRSSDIFHKLLADRRIALELQPSEAEVLRVSLIRKFKDYKQQTEKLGWLEDDLAQAVVSVEAAKHPDTGEVLGVVFYLRPRKRKEIEYKLLNFPIVTETKATSDNPHE